MSRPYTVLVVEDDDPLRISLVDVLSSRGWRVHAAARGAEAVDLARRFTLDFSIVDLHLPGMSGIEVLRRISSEIRPLPAIMMSGQATREETDAALSEGVFRFLRKPLDLGQLRFCMDQLIRQHLRR
jgi:DNA-binding response OmpR family regulator